jgi:hypothetical protein
MFIVYLAVDFFQLYIDIMQKLLNTHSFALYPPLLRMLSNAKAGLVAALTFLLLVSLTNSVQAASFDSNYITIGTGINPTVNRVYYTNRPGPSSSTPFDNINLGSFAPTGNLFLSGTANTIQSSTELINATVLLYRVYRSDAPTKPDFQELALATTSTTDTKVWQTSGQPNLLTAINGTGTYVLELFYRLDFTGTAANTIYDNNQPKGLYSASFEVTGNPPSTWLGKSEDWNTASNWDKGVPDLYTDVTIPYNTDNSFIYPTITGTAQVRTLTIQGDDGGQSATLLIDGGNLQVYGDLQDPYNGLQQPGNGALTLAGSTQTFSAVRLNNMVIQGGGQKILAEKNAQGVGTFVRMEIYNTLTFNDVAGGGVIVTGTTSPVTQGVSLGSTARVIGESEGSYVLGIATTVRRVSQAAPPETFGGIGLSLVSNATAPGQVTVTRYNGLKFPNVGTRGESANRYFVVLASTRTTSNYTLTLNYLNRELNGNDASTLAIYTATTGRTNFTSLGRGSSSDVTAKTVTVPGIASNLSATFTLGQTAPLPVTLVSFTATPTAQGAALLRWVTAKELNNKGFGIERTLGPTDTWKEVGYVETTNTPNGKSYEYTDKSLVSAPASTQAYYRLRQEDLDGTVSYSPVAAVARPAVVPSTNSNLVLSPVPVDGPNLSVSFAEAGLAGQEVAIINTQGQRMLHFTTQNSGEATLSLPVANLAAGVYIVRIQTPGQAVRHARFVKL